MTRKFALAPLLLLLTTLPMCGGGSGDGGTGSADGGTSPTADSVTSPTNGGTSPAPTGDSARSTLRVKLTDKPAEDYLAVNVTIVAVRVHQSSAGGELDAGWVDLPVTAAMPVDLLTLRNGVLYELCQQQLPVGHYQQVRLELAPNSGAEPPFNQSVVTPDDVTHALEVQSATIKIVHGFTVDAQQTTDLTLDFDAAQSVKKRGKDSYFMTPVLKASSSKAD